MKLRPLPWNCRMMGGCQGTHGQGTDTLLGNPSRNQPKLQPVAEGLTPLSRLCEALAIGVQDNPDVLLRRLASLLDKIPQGIGQGYGKVATADRQHHTRRCCPSRDSLAGFSGFENIQVGIDTL